MNQQCNGVGRCLRQRLERCVITELLTPRHILRSHSSIGPQRHHAAGMIAILTQFGLGSLANSLRAIDGVHEPWNMLSLEPHTHGDFDSLDLWFEGTDTVC